MAKNLYKRPRPYVANPKIKPCISLESSYAFPSGHTLMVYVYAGILAEIFPERAQILTKRAEQYALNRVVGGVHHPTDVLASVKMGHYLVKEMVQSRRWIQAMAQF